MGRKYGRIKKWFQLIGKLPEELNNVFDQMEVLNRQVEGAHNRMDSIDTHIQNTIEYVEQTNKKLDLMQADMLASSERRKGEINSFFDDKIIPLRGLETLKTDLEFQLNEIHNKLNEMWDLYLVQKNGKPAEDFTKKVKEEIIELLGVKAPLIDKIIIDKQRCELIEYDFINLVNGNQLLSLLEKEGCTENIYLYGYLAKNIVYGKEIPGTQLLENWDDFIKNDRNCGCMVVSSLYMILKLIKEHYIKSYYKFIKKDLMLLTPYIEKENDACDICWGEGFSDCEKNEDSSTFWSWYCGEEGKGSIELYNYSDKYKKVILSFKLITLDPKAFIIIKIHGKQYDYSMEGGELDNRYEINLRPGLNQVDIYYLGSLVIAESDNRRLQFSIKDMRLEDFNCDRIYERDQIYDNRRDIPALYDYLVKENQMREELHQQGFFEIERVYLNTEDEPEYGDTTRFSEQTGSYYLYKKGKQPQGTGICVYIARRMGLPDMTNEGN